MSNFLLKDYYLDPRVTEVNRLPARSRRTTCESLSLDGTWQFRLFDHPDLCGAFYLRDLSDDQYGPIQVPGNWETQGHGMPIYTNNLYPWSGEGENGLDGAQNPWQLPPHNPTGCYRTTFALDAIDTNFRYVLRLDGVEVAYDLYINEQFVGYAEDSKLAGEFDVTKYLIPGENLIALRVFSYATGSFLENQDYWYLCGIFRPVSLIKEPVKHIEDIKIEAVPERHSDRAVLTAEIIVPRLSGFHDWIVRATLLDKEGNTIGSDEHVICPVNPKRFMDPRDNKRRLTIEFDHVERWYPENPYLYTLNVELMDASGAPLDHETLRVGFKRVEIENGVILINGKRALFFGVNRHEHAWRTGRTVTREYMEAEIRQMKSLNINAVRTSHYPNLEDWYDLCDEMGMLVLAECNVETHSAWYLSSENTPAAANAYIERALRTVVQLKNHASIYAWSLGNEAANGAKHASMYGFIKEYDKTRFCQYESGFPGPNISDVRCMMYATEKEIIDMVADIHDNRPVVLIEYLYQIRNSGGGMRKFADLMRRYDRFQGAFVWDWLDKSLVGKTEDGQEFFAHGGDFGEHFIEPYEPPYMCNNGLMRADMVVKPVAHDVREAYAPMTIERQAPGYELIKPSNRGTFCALNRSLMHTSDDYTFTMHLQDKDGREFARLPLEVPCISSGEEVVLKLKDELDAYIPQGIMYVEFSVVHTASGNEVSRRQYLYYDAVRELPKPAAAPAPAISEDDASITLSGDTFRAVFAKSNAALLEYQKDGIQKACGAHITLDRPYCGIDAREGWNIMRTYMDEVRALQLDHTPAEILTGKNSVIVTSDFTAQGLSGTISWTVYGDGTILCAMDGQVAEGVQLPRFGLEFTLPGSMQNVAYTGYGPHETYADRMIAARFGQYSSTVDGLGFDIAPPSENGGHEGTVDLSLSGEDGGISFAAAHPFHFDARNCTVEDLKLAMHAHEIPHRENITLHLDAWHMPIGGDMSWSTVIDINEAPHAAMHTLRVMIG